MKPVSMYRDDLFGPQHAYTAYKQWALERWLTCESGYTSIMIEEVLEWQKSEQGNLLLPRKTLYDRWTIGEQ